MKYTQHTQSLYFSCSTITSPTNTIDEY